MAISKLKNIFWKLLELTNTDTVNVNTDDDDEDDDDRAPSYNLSKLISSDQYKTVVPIKPVDSTIMIMSLGEFEFFNIYTLRESLKPGMAYTVYITDSVTEDLNSLGPVGVITKEVVDNIINNAPSKQALDLLEMFRLDESCYVIFVGVKQ